MLVLRQADAAEDSNGSVGAQRRADDLLARADMIKQNHYLTMCGKGEKCQTIFRIVCVCV